MESCIIALPGVVKARLKYRTKAIWTGYASAFARPIILDYNLGNALQWKRGDDDDNDDDGRHTTWAWATVTVMSSGRILPSPHSHDHETAF